MTLIRPVELAGQALAQSFRDTVAEVSGDSWEQTGVTLPSKEVWDRYAKAVLTELRRHGFINEHCLELIHLEEDANGEARSSVIPGERG